MRSKVHGYRVTLVRYACLGLGVVHKENDVRVYEEKIHYDLGFEL